MKKRDCVFEWTHLLLLQINQETSIVRIMTLGKMDAMMICQFGFPLPRYVSTYLLLKNYELKHATLRFMDEMFTQSSGKENY